MTPRHQPTSSTSQRLRAVAVRAAERISLALPGRIEARLADQRLDAQRRCARVRFLRRLLDRDDRG